MSEGQPIPIVLCGSGHATSYLPALVLAPGFELAGVLARGSERSMALAEKLGVPLWLDAGDIDERVRAAIVAVAPGAADPLTRTLLEHGLHVLQEHPVSAQALTETRGVATDASRVHHVNCHFAAMDAPWAFIAEARRRAALGPALHASVVCAARTAFATFDVLGRALGEVVGASLEQLPAPKDASGQDVQSPFLGFQGSIAGVPVRLLCSSAIAGVDDGSDSPVPQRIQLVFEDGNLALLGITGPVVWSSWLRLSDIGKPDPVWTLIGPEHGADIAELMQRRAAANGRALQEFAACIIGGEEPGYQSAAWLSTLDALTRIVRPDAVW